MKEEYSQDINKTTPVFLKPSDFLKNNDNFDSSRIFFSCYAYKKTPVLIIDSFEELEKVIGNHSSDDLMFISHFVY